MRTAWLSVNASEGEGWGLSVIEANFSGSRSWPIGARVSGNSIRDGETGWLIEEGQDLAKRSSGRCTR